MEMWQNSFFNRPHYERNTFHDIKQIVQSDKTKTEILNIWRILK